MKKHDFKFKEGIFLGFIAGIIWGWISIAVNSVTGAFPFENSLIYNFVTFTVGGAIFGIVTGSFMAVAQEYLPFKKPFPKAVLLSTFIWTILRVGGAFLTMNMPIRYHPVTPQTIQGFALSILLGCILGFLWNRSQK